MSDENTNASSSAPPAPFDARGDAIARNLQRRLGTSGGSAVGVAVPNGATSFVVTFARREFDALFGVALSVSWDTRFWITARSGTGFTLNFSTAAPANATADYLVFRAG
jgi:hypothetical protein